MLKRFDDRHRYFEEKALRDVSQNGYFAVSTAESASEHEKTGKELIPSRPSAVVSLFEGNSDASEWRKGKSPPEHNGPDGLKEEP